MPIPLKKFFLEDPRLSRAHRIYIQVFGIPISGLRIRLRRILPKIEGNFSSILDLGCGKGLFTFALSQKFPDAKVIGVDIDEEQIHANQTIAKKHNLTNIEFKVQDILKMEFENEFDLILSVDNLEHIEEDDFLLTKIRAALKPGGKFVCHVPALKRIWVFKKMAINFDVPGHARPGYEKEVLGEKFTRAGLSLQVLTMTYGYLETVSNNLSYLVTGARQKNAGAYALIFPFLNLMSWIGRKQDPKNRGAGVFAIATK